MGAVLFHEDGERTDGQTDMTKLTVAFHNFEKGPQKYSYIFPLELSRPKLVHNCIKQCFPPFFLTVKGPTK